MIPITLCLGCGGEIEEGQASCDANLCKEYSACDFIDKYRFWLRLYPGLTFEDIDWLVLGGYSPLLRSADGSVRQRPVTIKHIPFPWATVGDHYL